MLIFSTQVVLAQSCLPSGISFTSQAQVDSFQVMYPGCIEIEGSVRITGESITDLNGLSQLEAIGGDLRIDSTALLDLDGLNNMIAINGSLQIHGNEMLKKMDGLENLYEVGGGLAIKYNPVLNSLSGLANVTTIDGLYVEYNDNLQSLYGLHSLEGSLIDIQIFGNEMLYDLTALSGLTGVSRYLEFIDNPSLESLDGIDNLLIEAYLITLVDNYNLSQCAVQSICNYFDTPHPGWWTVDIRVNDAGCNSVQEVKDSCDVIIGLDEQHPGNTMRIYPNPADHKIFISAEGQIIDEAIFYTLTGQQVMLVRPEDEVIDVSSLQPGMYITEISVNNRKLRKKLIIK